MSDEKVYQFDDYILGYDKGLKKDRSCLTICKIKNGNMYVISSLYDESADLISNMLDHFKERIAYLERSNDRREDEILSLRDEAIENEIKCDNIAEYIRNVKIYGLRSGKTFIQSICNDMLEIIEGGDENDKNKDK